MYPVLGKESSHRAAVLYSISVPHHTPSAYPTASSACIAIGDWIETVSPTTWVKPRSLPSGKFCQTENSGVVEMPSAH